MQLSRREIELVVEELRPLLVPSRVQRIFEADPKSLVFQQRAPGRTFHLLLSTGEATRLHLVDEKPDQPQHPSPFTMQLRKWLRGAWLESLVVSDKDRIVRFAFEAIDPDWEPRSDDEKAPRISLTLIAELVGRHPNLILVDPRDEIIGVGPGKLLGDRPGRIGEIYELPPPPPKWADDEQIRFDLDQIRPDGSRSEFLSHHYRQTLAEQRRRQLKADLESRLAKRSKRLRRRIDNIEGDLSHIEDADEYRRRGELLQSAYGDVEAGAESATVPDFYRQGMPKIQIPLDPSKSLQENIDHYFHQYRRYKGAREKVEVRLSESQALHERLERSRRDLEGLEGQSELEKFRNTLLEEGLLKTPRPHRAGSRRDSKALPPYREFRALSGAPILVGRDARRNDELTTSVARGRDIWLHARDWRGSHVVLRAEKNEEPASEDLIDAAILAAHFSKGRTNPVVDITYTKAKYVRKPKGAAPGLVTVGGGSTLAVRAEGERLERLLASEVELR